MWGGREKRFTVVVPSEEGQLQNLRQDSLRSSGGGIAGKARLDIEGESLSEDKRTSRTSVCRTTSEQEQRNEDARAKVKSILQNHNSKDGILKTWFKQFDKNRNGKIDFEEFRIGMGNMRFAGDLEFLWEVLDADNSNEITFDEIDKSTANLWHMFRRWCGSKFTSPRDMIRRMKKLSKSLAVSQAEDLLVEEEFIEALNAMGWKMGFEEVLFSAIDCESERCIACRDLKWLEIEVHRFTQREAAKKAARRMALRKAQTKQAAQSALNDFRAFLKKQYGSLFRAWRVALDLDGSMTVTRAEVFKACRSMNWKGDVRALWKALDYDNSGVTELEELDPYCARVMAQFKEWATKLNGPKFVANLWTQIDRHHKKRVSYVQFAQECEARGFKRDKLLKIARWLDWEEKKYITQENFTFLESWKLPPYLTAEPDNEAAEGFKRALLKKYGHYLKAWRAAMDKDNSNSCNWHEFKDAAKHVRFTGSVAGAWLALDDDMSGFITLNEIDPEANQALVAFKIWTDNEFGGVRSAFKVLDADSSGELSYREFKASCRNYGYEGSVQSLFECVASEDRTGLTDEKKLFWKDIVFVDDWDIGLLGEVNMEGEEELAEADGAQDGATGSVTDSRLLEYRTSVPGPGAYNVPPGFGAQQKMPTARHGGTCTFTFRRPWLRLTKSVGPANYAPNLKTTSKQKPAWSFGTAHVRKDRFSDQVVSRAVSPGPADYDTRMSGGGPKFTMRPRRKFLLHPTQSAQKLAGEGA